MQSLNSSVHIMYADSTPFQPAKLIFDNTYKNMNEKSKFERDRKFAYFNTLTKLRNNFIQTNKTVYQYIFKPQQSHIEQPRYRQYQSMNSHAFPREIMGKKQSFHVEKIHNHAFKIYKQKRNKFSSYNQFTQNIQSINNVNFQFHFNNRGKNQGQSEKPKFQLLLNEYKKLQEMKSKVTHDKNESRSRKSSRPRMNTTFYANENKSRSAGGQRKDLSINSIPKFMAGKKDKNRINMSQLALRISS